jgi:hypothetical protein
VQLTPQQQAGVGKVSLAAPTWPANALSSSGRLR